MQYSASVYADSRAGDGLNQMLFSRANSFRMAETNRLHLAVRVARLSTPSCSIIRVTSSGHEIDLVDDDLATIMLPLSGTVRVRAAEDRFQAEASGSLTFLPGARQTSVEAARGGSFEALMLKMPLSALPTADNGRRLAPGGQSASSPLVKTSHASMMSLRELLEYATNDLASHQPILTRPNASRSVEVLIHEQFRSLFPVAEDGQWIAPVSAANVVAAEDFMQANFGEAIAVADIAEACGVGVRSLQTTFRRTTGVTLWTRLSEIRLDEAYLLLIAGTERSVTDIALSCGVAHLGRFAQAYRRRFGELPSDTRRRGRLGHPN